MKFFNRQRRTARQSWCLNSGFIYAALLALSLVVAKTLKYSGGGGSQDLPWAILIILASGMIGGLLWQVGKGMFDFRAKAKRNRRAREETGTNDDPCP